MSAAFPPPSGPPLSGPGPAARAVSSSPVAPTPSTSSSALDRHRAESTRPRARLAGALVLVGGVALGVSSALTWVHTASGSVTGFGDYYLRQHATWVLLHGPATFVIIMAVGLVAVAVTTLWSGRIVALAIAGVVLSALALIWMAACAGFAAQTRTYLGGGTLGPGVGVGVAASLVSLCGSVWTLVRRGRPRSDSTATR